MSYFGISVLVFKPGLIFIIYLRISLPLDHESYHVYIKVFSKELSNLELCCSPFLNGLFPSFCYKPVPQQAIWPADHMAGIVVYFSLIILFKHMINKHTTHKL